MDVVCPWCYVGKRRLDAALARFDHRDEVELTVRSFELDPSAPAVREGSHAEMLAGKYGGTVAEARARLDQLTELGRADGIAFDFEIARQGNSFDAHRLIHLAAAEGVADAVVERLLRGYFGEGLAIGDREALLDAAAEANLDRAAAAAALADGAYAQEVRADEEQAQRYGIRGVPFLVLDGRYGLSGAQPADAYLQALEQAWEEHRSAA